MNLALYLVKQALSPHRDLARRSGLAQQQYDQAMRRNKQYELINELVRNTKSSPWVTGGKGALLGAGTLGLGSLPLAAHVKSPGVAIGGLALGALGGGLLGSQIPRWSREELQNYATGREHPVFYENEESLDPIEAPLSNSQRSLVRRVIGGRHV
jgi:hypothetical protein